MYFQTLTLTAKMKSGKFKIHVEHYFLYSLFNYIRIKYISTLLISLMLRDYCVPSVCYLIYDLLWQLEWVKKCSVVFGWIVFLESFERQSSLCFHGRNIINERFFFI